MNGVFATAMGPGSVEAARMAAEEFGGRINGKPIEILQADHQNKPDLAASLARKWFSDGVQAIADGGSSGAALAVQELVRGNGRIFLISGAGANQLTDEACAPTSVQWTQDAFSTATAVVSGIMQTSKEPWFFITGDYAFGHSIEATARERIAALGGKVAGSVKAQLGTPDYSSFLLQAQSSGAKILAINVAGDPDISFTQTHQVILNVGYAKGPEIANRLERNNIIVNYQAAPQEEGFTASGSLRMGVQEMTRFGMQPEHFQELAGFLGDVIIQDRTVKKEISTFRRQFLDMQYCFSESQFEDEIQKLHALLK